MSPWIGLSGLGSAATGKPTVSASRRVAAGPSGFSEVALRCLGQVEQGERPGADCGDDERREDRRGGALEHVDDACDGQERSQEADEGPPQAAAFPRYIGGAEHEEPE